MNVLIVTPIFPPEIGGPATYVSELATRLTTLGHNVSVVTFSHNPHTASKQREACSVKRISTSGNFFTRQLRLFLSLWQYGLKADVVYAQGTIVVGFISFLYSLLTQKKFVVKFVGDEIWETAFNSNQTNLSLEDFYKAQSVERVAFNLIYLHRLILKSAHVIIVPSNYLKQFLITSHGIPTKKIVIIPNAVELNQNSSKKNQDQYIVVGRLAKTKRVDVIIQAFIDANIPNSKLIIVGDGPERKALEKLRTSYPVLRTNIQFTGALPQAKVEKLIARSSKLILMSNYEGQSHTLIQALLHQTGIITTPIAPNQELCGDYAQYVKPTVKDLTKALVLPAPMMKDRELASFKETHSWKNHIDTLIHILE